MDNYWELTRFIVVAYGGCFHNINNNELVAEDLCLDRK
jgi:hypothetical protein